MTNSLLDDEELGEGTGGGKLRAKLEESLEAQRALTERLSTYEAREYLEGKDDLSLVKPEDLKGVAAHERDAKAQSVQQERQTLQEELLRDALQRQGLEGDDLADALAELVAEHTQHSEDAEKSRRMRSAGNVDAKPAPRVDTSKLSGFDAIRAGVEPKKTTRRV